MGLKALLVGINDYSERPLRGCVNDITVMREVLQQKYGIADDSLHMLQDEAATTAAITEELAWLAEPDGSDTPQVRLFHFSGHGIFKADESGDEPDGQDEAIVPYDYQTAGAMTDDVLRDLYARFPSDTHLLLTMDCCHSGTVQAPAMVGMDVIYRVLLPEKEEVKRIRAARRRFDTRRRQIKKKLEAEAREQQMSSDERTRYVEQELARLEHKQPFGGDTDSNMVVLIAACRDDQVAADARFEEGYNGALTYFLTSALQEAEEPPTYADLITHLAETVTANKFMQVPQLECSEENRSRPFLNQPFAVMQRSGEMTSEQEPPASDEREEESVLDELPPEFLEGLLPYYDEEEAENVELSRAVSASHFLYLGDGLKADEFTSYVESYDFGSQPPNFVVIHHTAIPDTQHARYNHGSWDASESGLSEQQIYQKRQRQLTGIREHYRTHPRLQWDRGPHLFIDDRWIWLFTPMYHMGIHAAGGNGYRSGGRLNYSIGIEVVGYYAQVQWPEPVANLVGHAVAVLKRKLGTFEITHQPFVGGISGHRDYNKPSCPGDAITETFYLGVIQAGWDRLQGNEAPTVVPPAVPTPPKTATTVEASILGSESGSLNQAVSYIKARLSAQSEYQNDVELIMSYYWKYAPPVEVDPFIAACQCIFETDSLRSRWAARPRRNPAGLGVRQEGGLSFATWEDGVQAHIGQLLAFALTDNEASEEQRQMMYRNPRHLRISPDHRGKARTLAGLNNRWTDDGQYAEKLVKRINDVRS